MIYCENGSIHNNGPLNARTPFTKNVYPIQSLVPADFWKKNLTLADKNQEGIYHETIPAQSTKNNNGQKSIDDEEGSPDAKKRASSAEQKGVAEKQGKNNVETIYKQLCLMMIYKTDLNSAFVGTQIARILSYLRNWELLSNREIKLACKTLNLISHSINGSLLAEQSNIIVLAKLLKSSHVKTEIKLAVVSFFVFQKFINVT